MITTTPLEKLRTEGNRIANEIGKIEARERRAENQKLIGNTYKCRTNYSCPKKPSDYWWIYIQVDGLDKDGYLQCFQFQTDRYGAISIQREQRVSAHSFDYDNYRKITKREFSKAWRSLQARIKALR
jgi:hypothetical protein